MVQADQITVAVVGATGFVGGNVVRQLAEDGHRVIAVSRKGTRRREWPALVETRSADVTSGRGLDDALAGADAVVHLVAIPREGGGLRFEDVNVGGTRKTVAAAERAGARRFVHLSVLGVTDDPNLRYLSSKWRGEEAVRSSALEWTILRPSLLFGPGDGFFSLIRSTLKWWSPGIVAIPGKGDATFQPLAVDDLARGLAGIVGDAKRSGEILEIGGPEHITYHGIVDAVMRATGMRRIKLGMPIPLISALTAVTDRVLPIFPVSHDQIQSLGRPNATELDAFERAFGFSPRPFDVSYLGRRG
jgi:uncharacterized protein YbjT (DUF2867 family)